MSKKSHPVNKTGPVEATPVPGTPEFVEAMDDALFGPVPDDVPDFEPELLEAADALDAEQNLADNAPVEPIIVTMDHSGKRSDEK